MATEETDLIAWPEFEEYWVGLGGSEFTKEVKDKEWKFGDPGLVITKDGSDRNEQVKSLYNLHLTQIVSEGSMEQKEADVLLKEIGFESNGKAAKKTSEKTSEKTTAKKTSEKTTAKKATAKKTTAKKTTAKKATAKKATAKKTSEKTTAKKATAKKATAKKTTADKKDFDFKFAFVGQRKNDCYVTISEKTKFISFSSGFYKKYLNDVRPIFLRQGFNGIKIGIEFCIDNDNSRQLLKLSYRPKSNSSSASVSPMLNDSSIDIKAIAGVYRDGAITEVKDDGKKRFFFFAVSKREKMVSK